MHEMSLAINIVALAEAECRAAGAGRIRRVEVEVGGLAGVMPEALRFCFAAACRETMAEGAELEIIVVDGQGECASCRRPAPMAEHFALCPACGGLMRPLQGQELRLAAIEVD
ncbi:hydrogenase maturation nickel metallochaperone HypA [Desulfurivibrio alkaliphilus]|uniref:Hydrogenase maturation factor HypA n=1 Tax=Desulfurivibrio alkaliphilus (strain DSM 19089 / UNIQEM U267 / AHT2) TaxID=589865 RepID=D6Z6H5_DESAT|nr:hydrogenase maturation nickel metallochaperone HypA [Desulfurivibrio alkaliphilus]ADH84934.1 hydrogenase expression/synthesis HypA [Desulfurivibrio alkaliphilus AHT 2]